MAEILKIAILCMTALLIALGVLLACHAAGYGPFLPRAWDGEP